MPQNRARCEEVGEGQLCWRERMGRLRVRAGQWGVDSRVFCACSSLAGGMSSPFADEKTEAQRA